MRIGIIGAGALGGTFAALLDRVGHEVVVTARGAQLAAIRERGLRLEGGYGEVLARVRAEEALPVTPDLALLAVKAQDAAAAAAQNARALDGVPVVVVQNGLQGPQALAAVLPTSPRTGAASMIAASFLSPGVVTVTAPGVTVLAAETATAAQRDAAAAVLGAVVEVRTAPDLAGLQWSKLVVNQLNAASAITGTPLQAALESRALTTAVAAAMRETIRVARADGVRLEGLPALPPALIRAIDRLPLPLASRVLRRGVAARMGDVPNPGSTLQSLRRGRPTEIDHLSGAVVAEGERLGVPTPVNRRIVEVVHAIEATGAFLPAGEAARALQA
ncbi:ketopantoate reductase family protein [Amnibacterium kyonggiense]|uniref:2-dehydropantoate 2-reductase n=1 Tax=Amnibacterium kyonggiense TaxID=595671 RepID=A0A4R7FEH4_9MICO|nr:2-dehydropantoate 2-reductase [Amnibacterium kyonggiense]TDS75729.1 ketopantoate reductase [Amnibacterium kyonggiense]